MARGGSPVLELPPGMPGISPALLLVETSQPGMLFVTGSVIDPIVRLWQGVSKDKSEVVCVIKLRTLCCYSNSSEYSKHYAARWW